MVFQFFQGFAEIRARDFTDMAGSPKMWGCADQEVQDVRLDFQMTVTTHLSLSLYAKPREVRSA